jgi:hypothetical protein
VTSAREKLPCSQRLRESEHSGEKERSVHFQGKKSRCGVHGGNSIREADVLSCTGRWIANSILRWSATSISQWMNAQDSARPRRGARGALPFCSLPFSPDKSKCTLITEDFAQFPFIFVASGNWAGKVRPKISWGDRRPFGKPVQRSYELRASIQRWRAGPAKPFRIAPDQTVMIREALC